MNEAGGLREGVDLGVDCAGVYEGGDTDEGVVLYYCAAEVSLWRLRGDVERQYWIMNDNNKRKKHVE